MNNQESKLKGFVAIHRGGLEKPAFGATRIWSYHSEEEALRDVLKLSRIMSYKSALAGLPYGGAKAVIISRTESFEKQSVLTAYSHFVNYLGGTFITGADVGVNPEDLKTMATHNKFIVGLKSDPVKFTSLGVYYSIQVCLQEIFGSEALHERTLAIQGLGKTGMELLKLVYNEAKKVYVSDVNATLLEQTKKDFPNVEIVDSREIMKCTVDVFSPCALSNAITAENMASLKCNIIAGAANSQLEDSYIGELLYKLGILYAPDYIVNAGGLLTVADEYEHGDYNEERLNNRVLQIKKTLSDVIETSKQSHRAINVVADEKAKLICDKLI